MFDMSSPQFGALLANSAHASNQMREGIEFGYLPSISTEGESKIRITEE
jgi:hypothetical protein